jgi:predicted TIM-barrel fold metal-dependent hydrolase
MLEILRKVNDVHIHLGRSSMIKKQLLADEIFHYRKEYGLDHMMLFTLDVDIDENNKKIIEITKEHDFLHGLYWVQHSRINEDVEILSKELGSGIVGVKFHGVFEKKSVADPVYEPILELLNKKKSILLVHCGRFKDGNPESNSSYVHTLEVAKKYSDIKVIFGHMGGNDTGIVKAAVNSAKDLANTYFETSGITTPLRVEYAVDVLGPERVLFGSDFPWCSFRSMYYAVEDALISEEDKEMIFTKNFLKLIS